MNEVKVQAMIAELESQRNAANTALVYKSAELADANRQIDELNERITKLDQELLKYAKPEDQVKDEEKPGLTE